MKSRRFFTVAMVSFAALTFASCVSVVRRPAFDGVKKVGIAVISINEMIIEVDSGRTYGGTLADLATKVGKGDITARSPKTQMVYDAVTSVLDESNSVWEEELGKVKGFAVTPTKEVMASPGYADFSRGMRRIWGDGSDGFLITAFDNEMAYMPVFGFRQDEEFAASSRVIAKLCQDLGLDGIAIIGMNLRYVKDVNLFTSSVAEVYVTAQLRVYNSNGDLAVSYFGQMEQGPNTVEITTNPILGFTFDESPKEVYLENVKVVAEIVRETINGAM